MVINNGWRAPLADGTAASPIVITHVGRPPAEPTDGPWEVVCCLGRSFGHNRAEPTADLLGPTAIIDRYTEAIAKGGHLRLSIGVGADGVIPDEVAGRLTDDPMYRARYSDTSDYDAAAAMAARAGELGLHPATLAVAWCASHPHVTAALIGGRSLDQLQPSLAAIDVELGDDERAALSTLTPTPPPPTDRSELGSG